MTDSKEAYKEISRKQLSIMDKEALINRVEALQEELHNLACRYRDVCSNKSSGKAVFDAITIIARELKMH